MLCHSSSVIGAPALRPSTAWRRESSEALRIATYNNAVATWEEKGEGFQSWRMSWSFPGIS
jgi:hypothetical protein